MAAPLVLVVLLASAGPRGLPPATSPSRPAASHAAAKPNPSAGTRAGKGKGKAKALPRWAPIELYHVNRRETLKLRIADDRGRPVRGLDKRVRHFLRCHYTNTEHAMDPRLVRLLYETGRYFGGRRVEVVSGYRHPTVARNPKSPHMRGLACDFRVVGVSNVELRDHLRRTYEHVGVGYYPNSSFVHLDVRGSGPSAFWIDYSRPKEDAIYSDAPLEDLRSGKADTWKPSTIDPAWADTPDETPSATSAAPRTEDPSLAAVPGAGP